MMAKPEVIANVMPTILILLKEFNFVSIYCSYYPEFFKMYYTLSSIQMPPNYLFSYDSAQ